jgi:hypothetical protein
MKADRFLLVALVGAIAALGGTTAWAVVRTTDRPSTTNYYGGMMGAGSSGMMGSGSMMGSGGMTGYASAQGETRVESLGEAKRLAQRFADRLGLKADEVLQFERNYYAKLVDAKGAGATEVLVDPQTGTVSLEYGPAMMWNTRYGLHGRDGRQTMGRYGAGMMGGGSGGMMGGSGTAPAPGSPGSVSIGRARELGQRWLDANGDGLKVEAGGDSFPGYYTFEVLKQGKIQGMLSVNASSGAVIYHWWHGAFLAEVK